MTDPRYEYDEAGEMLVENDGTGGVRVVAFRVLPSFGRWVAERAAPAGRIDAAHLERRLPWRSRVVAAWRVLVTGRLP